MPEAAPAWVLVDPCRKTHAAGTLGMGLDPSRSGKPCRRRLRHGPTPRRRCDTPGARPTGRRDRRDSRKARPTGRSGTKVPDQWDTANGTAMGRRYAYRPSCSTWTSSASSAACPWERSPEATSPSMRSSSSLSPSAVMARARCRASARGAPCSAARCSRSRRGRRPGGTADTPVSALSTSALYTAQWSESSSRAPRARSGDGSRATSLR